MAVKEQLAGADSNQNTGNSVEIATTAADDDSNLKPILASRGWKYDVFLCHSGENMSFVRLLDMEMRKLKIVAFLDTGDLQMKGIAQKEIIEAIIHSPFFVVILSQEFIGKKIPNAELEAALEFDPSNKSTVSVFYNVTSKRYVQSPIERLMQLPKIERKGETEEQFAILVAKFVQGHIRQQLRQDTLKVSNLGEFSERNWDEDVFQLLSELINELRQLTGSTFDDERIYERSCKYGKLRVIRVLCDIMGEEDSGKSCFADSLMDKPFVENRDSTKGLKVRMMTHAIGDGTNWKELTKGNERMQHISRLLAKQFLVQRREQSKDEEVSHGVDKMGEEEEMRQEVNDKTDDEREMSYEVGEKDEETEASQAVQKNVADKEISQGMDKKDEEKEVSLTGDSLESAIDIDTAHVNTEIKTSEYDHFQGANQLDPDTQEAIRLMREDEEELKKCEEMILVTLTDRGGQDQFLSTHAALMADDTHQSRVCFLVLDSKKSLYDAVPETKFRLPDGRVIEKPRDIAVTRADLIRYYFTALKAAFPRDQEFPNFLGMGVVERPPATFIVSTKKDKMNGAYPSEQEKELLAIIKELKFTDRIVKYKDANGRSRFLFHVDNSKSGKGNPDDTVVRIKNMIIDMARKRWTKEDSDLINVTWITLDKGLGLLRMAGSKVLDIDKVYTLAATVCGIDTKIDCKEALKYLSSHASIGFYHKVDFLKEKVLPNLQWVADLMAIFFTLVDDNDFQEDADRDIGADFDELRKHGRMSCKLFKFMLSKAKSLLDGSMYDSKMQLAEKDQDDVIRNLLQLFNVIAQEEVEEEVEEKVAVQRDQKYYVPCMVEQEMIEIVPIAYKSALCSTTAPPPLFITPKGFSCFLSPLFYRLIVRLIPKFSSDRLPLFSRKQVIFHLHKGVDLELVYTKDVVIFTVFAPPNNELPKVAVLAPLCVEVREKILRELTEAKKRGMDGFEFELCVHSAAEKLKEPCYDLKRLASLDKYLIKDEILEDRNQVPIRHPCHLGVWYGKTFGGDCTYDEKATSKEVTCLARSIQSCWEEFAAVLDAELFTAPNIKAIAVQNRELFMQAWTMLDTWRSHHGGKAYRHLLIQALIEVDQRKVANDVFEEGDVERVSPQH